MRRQGPSSFLQVGVCPRFWVAALAIGLAGACGSSDGSPGDRGDAHPSAAAAGDWCHDTYAPEGSSWYAIHRDRCISDFVPTPAPRCIRKVATGMESDRLMPGVTLGRNGERIFGNAWADFPGESNTYGMEVTEEGRVTSLWSDVQGQLVAYGTPVEASMWRIRRDALVARLRAPGIENDADLLAALEASPRAWVYLTEDELAADGRAFVRPPQIALDDPEVEAGEVAFTLEAPPPPDGRSMRLMHGEVSATGYWGPGRGSGDGTPEVVFRTRDAERLQSVAPSGGNLTSDGHFVAGTGIGDVLVVHRLTGAVLAWIRLADAISDRLGLGGERRLTADSTLNLNSTAVARNVATGRDHLYVALTHGRQRKLAGPGGVDFELEEAEAGYMAGIEWDPARRRLRLLWVDRLDPQLSEASPTVHPGHGTVFSAFGFYAGVEDSVLADIPTTLYAWSPNGERVAEVSIGGRSNASPAVVPADPARGFHHDYVVIGAGPGKPSFPKVFRFDLEGRSLTPVSKPRWLVDPILTTNLYVDVEGLLFTGAIFARDLARQTAYFGVFDIRDILQERPGAEVRLVDRVEVRSISCNNVAYDAFHRRYMYSMACGPAWFDPNDPAAPEGLHGIEVLGEDAADDPADGCDME